MNPTDRMQVVSPPTKLVATLGECSNRAQVTAAVYVGTYLTPYTTSDAVCRSLRAATKAAMRAMWRWLSALPGSCYLRMSIHQLCDNGIG